MTAPRYTADDLLAQAVYESSHERTSAMLRQAAETERALADDDKLSRAIDAATGAGWDNDPGVWNAAAACKAFRESLRGRTP